MSELQVLFQSGGHLHLSVHVPRVAQIHVGVLCVPFICWQVFSIDLHRCCLILTDFQDFKGFFEGWLRSFVPEHLVFFTTEMRLCFSWKSLSGAKRKSRLLVNNFFLRLESPKNKLQLVYHRLLQVQEIFLSFVTVPKTPMSMVVDEGLCISAS